jgi:Domain of unknown function (DUF929)
VHEHVTDTGTPAPTDEPRIDAVGDARTLHLAVWARLVIGIAVAVLGTVLIVKVFGGSSIARTTTDLSPTSASVLHEVTGIPLSVYDEVGVSSPSVPVVPPVLLSGTHALTQRSASGRLVPIVLFIGTEYNSFSAAERWPLIAALSRFGTFQSLYDVQSSPTDFAPNTPTFSFYGVDYHSNYVAFRAFEVASDVLGPSGYRPLMTVPRAFSAEERLLDPSMTIPFVDVANVAVAREVGLSPITFIGLSRDQIAGALWDPTNAVTQPVVVSANFLTAAICLADHQRPDKVCGSRGVLLADAALGIASDRPA